MKKTALITGSNRGIGKELVKAFAEAGYDIWACARTAAPTFEADMKELAESHGVSVKPKYFDLSKEDQIQLAVKEIIAEKRPIDVLINNAGVPYNGLLAMTPISKLREVYEINVFAQVKMMQLVGRQMMKQRSGCIINMCSVGGIEANPGYLAYGSSKAALIWITKSAAKEFGPYNVRVNGIAPGLVDTDMGKFKPAEELQKTINRTILGRLGTPEEIAQAALFIASKSSAFMTGHIMVIDGGRIG